MALFDPRNQTSSDYNRKLYAAYEIAYTLVDFAAAILFVLGSVLFFFKPLETVAIWCFVVGSVCFALKPTIRVAREMRYVAVGDVEDAKEVAEH